MKLSNDTLKLVGRLPKEKRDKVDAIVRRHTSACYKNGFPPENLDRVYIEAIEIVDIEARHPEPVIEENEPVFVEQNPFLREKFMK